MEGTPTEGKLMVDRVVVYACKVPELMPGDLIALPDPRSVTITTITPSGTDYVIDSVVAFDAGAMYGEPDSTGEPFTVTLPGDYIVGRVTRPDTKPAPSPVTEAEIRAQWDLYQGELPALMEAMEE